MFIVIILMDKPLNALFVIAYDYLIDRVLQSKDKVCSV